jgi:hypothetical protein
MSGEKLRLYIIFKGKDTRGSRAWKEFSTPELQNKNEYSKDPFYAVQKRPARKTSGSWTGPK